MRGSPFIHHSSAWVSKRIRIVSLTLEGSELVLRQRLEEAVWHLELASVGAEATFDRLGWNGGQARNGSLATDDHNLLSGLGALYEAREVRLGGMDGHGSHRQQIG
jgi:hypothetical protein